MTFHFHTNNGCFGLKQPLFFILIALLINNCSNQETTDRDNKVLFQVNGIERTVHDFESNYVDHLIKTGSNDSKKERFAYLNKMIDELILAESAGNKGLLDHPKYQNALKFQERKSMMDVYFLDQMSERIEPPTDEELRLAYDKKKRDVYVRHLFSLNEEELLEPYQRLKAGESFVDVANDFYETAFFDSTAGYLGKISYFGVDHAFAEAAFSTNEGDFTAPVRSRYGYHIIYVEYLTRPAMHAEDDFQYRKEGLTSQVRLRKQQLVSDSYVRELMESLDVKGNRDNLAALNDAIVSVEGDEILLTQNELEKGITIWSDDRLAALEASFPNEAVLASFVLGGERVDFTFGDYLKWLPYLSFEESKIRTGASVGRAMRNEVLYQLADKDGYASDDRVVKRVKDRGYEILSDLYQFKLTQEALADTHSVEVPDDFRNRFIRDRKVEIDTKYWKIPANDVEEARKLRERVANGDSPVQFDGYKAIEAKNMNFSNDDYEIIRKGIVNMPVVAHTKNEGWLVLNILEREVKELSTTTSVNNLETRYKVYENIYHEVDSLRSAATVVVDTTLFNDIYEVWKKTEN